MATDVTPVLTDLQDEFDDLHAVVAGVELEADTPAAGWDVRDTVAHLAGTDVEAVRALTDPDGFVRGLEVVARDIESFLTGQLTERRGLTRAELTASWQEGFARLVAALRTPAQQPVPWYGPPMSPTSFGTARLMEYWAHGQDIADAAGVQRRPTDRLRHICHLGVRTRGFAYANRGLDAPDVPVRVELESPGGQVWTYGSGDDVVRGSALDFCLLVTQRRHRADVGLTAEGTAADQWLDIAQCFAGPPGPGRPPSTG